MAAPHIVADGPAALPTTKGGRGKKWDIIKEGIPVN